MLVAEELECDWSKVKAEFVHAARERAARPGLGQHVDRREPLASRLRRHDLRRAGATAREMLIAAAAARWNVPAAECTAANSVITHRPSGRSVDLRRGGRRGGRNTSAEASRA